MTSGPKQHSFDDVKGVLLRLGAIEPSSSWVYERLGDESIERVPSEETASYYAKAATVHERFAVEHWGGVDKVPAQWKSEFDRKQLKYTAFGKIAPEYERRKKDVKLAGDNYPFERVPCDKPGTYIVQVRSPLSTTAATADFSATASRPDAAKRYLTPADNAQIRIHRKHE